MNEKLRLYFGIVMLAMVVIFFCVGWYLIVHGVRHLADTGTEAAGLKIAGIGGVHGAPPLLCLCLGVLTVAIAVGYSYRTYCNLSKMSVQRSDEESIEDEDRDISFEPTALGKRIALMRKAKHIIGHFSPTIKKE